MSLYSSSVKRPVTVILIFVAVIIIGMFSLQKLPIDLFPDIETNTIMVMTSYQGASAEDIEQNLTRPLENTLNSVEHLKHITSNSRENISIVTLEFEYGYDIDALTNDVRDKLDMISSFLPDDANTPVIFKFSSDMIPIVLLSAQAHESMPGLYKILDENVANPLARVDGVGSVSIAGAPKREIHVYLDPLRMEGYNLTVEAIAALIGAENRNIPGGTFDLGSDTYSLRVQGEFKDPKEMANLVVGYNNGGVVHLSDVATIDDSLEERAQETYNNGVKGAMVIVQKQSGANSVEISYSASSVGSGSFDIVPVQQYAAEKTVSLYPNPATEQLHVEAEGFRQARIFSMDGRCLKVVRTSDISLEGLAAGLYLLQVEHRDGAVVVKKFVKE